MFKIFRTKELRENKEFQAKLGVVMQRLSVGLLLFCFGMMVVTAKRGTLFDVEGGVLWCVLLLLSTVDLILWV